MNLQSPGWNCIKGQDTVKVGIETYAAVGGERGFHPGVQSDNRGRVPDTARMK